MKKHLLHLLPVAISLFTALNSFGQNGDLYWKPITTANKGAVVKENKRDLTKLKLFELNIEAMKKILAGSPKRAAGILSNIVVSFPDHDGKLDNYTVYENSNMDPALAEKYPDIKSYIGKAVGDPTALIYFSISPLGLQTMLLKASNEPIFIEPYTKDLKSYAVYRNSERPKSPFKFECHTIDQAIRKTTANRDAVRPNADDGILRTLRLAASANGEYTAYYGGTVALALAAINSSVTRINAIFETDLGLHLNLIANTNLLIYTNAATDPYSDGSNSSAWTSEVQANIDAVIGNANYDIGHMFDVGAGGGNGGCIGCVCDAGVKGQGWSSIVLSREDFFDVEILAHEMGHQLGGNHTFTSVGDEGTIAQVEAGIGATIMSYSGYGTPGVDDYLTAPYAYFHAVSIQQITDNLKSKTCPTSTATGNAIPTANAGADYTIPKGTPFALSGEASDANNPTGLTFNWEQMDRGNPSASIPNVNSTTGPAFRNFDISTNKVRYFPELPTILAGATATTFEALPNVARTLNFRFIVRDNHAGGPANNSDDVVVTVDGNTGPFAITSNLSGTYSGSSSQTVTWSVNGTNTGTPNVRISLSTDGGLTFPTVLLASTSNDGSQAVTLPNITTTTARIKVEAIGNIFFDISNNNFSINAVANSFVITASAGANGSISPNGAVSVASGSSQAFTITPNSCYKVADVKVDNVSQGAITSYTFSNVTAPHTISATFSLLTYTITASAGPGGTISPNGASNVNCGTNKTYTISPNTGYSVQDVKVDGNSQGPITTYTFNNVTAPHTISATFTNACTAPSMPGPISGQTTNLCGGGYFTYSIAPVPGATSYIWSVSGNSACTISGSTTATTVKIRLASYFYGTVTLTVRAKNSCGTSQARSLMLKDEPAAPASITGPSNVAKYQSNLVYEVPYTSGLSYYWSVEGGTITSKPAPNKIVVKWGRYSGKVKIKLGNKCGYSSWTEKQITVSSAGHDNDIENPVTEMPYLKTYPNPAASNTSVVFNARNTAAKYRVEVRDIAGRLITTRSGNTVKGVNVENLDVSKYAASMYIINLTVEGEAPRAIRLIKAD